MSVKPKPKRAARPKRVGPRPGNRAARPKQIIVAAAQTVIERADSRHPADAELRKYFKNGSPQDRSFSSEIAEHVFAFYRWRGWLEEDAKLSDQIVAAYRRDKQFRDNKIRTNAAELRAHAVPGWVASQLRAPTGWLQSLQIRPVLWIRARAERPARLLKILSGCKQPYPQTLPNALRYLDDEDLYRHPFFQDGRIDLQDVASQAVSHICGPEPGQTWWDACAGVGGKTLHLSDLMQNKGMIWASDSAAWRLDQLKRRLARAGAFNYRSVVWKNLERPPTRTQFDGVLVDAPCSGLGAWRRNPHGRWTVTPKDVLELARKQRDLLNAAAKGVKPGGKLIYAVCTMTQSETAVIADSFSRSHPDFEPLPFLNPCGETARRAPRLTLWPHRTDGVGMFIAAWRRVPASARSHAKKKAAPKKGRFSTKKRSRPKRSPKKKSL